MHRSRRIVDFIFIFILGIVIFSAFLVFSPYSSPIPHRDSAIFIHVGSQLLEGKILYQQTWDHKQPLVYIINAIGLWLGGGSTWGVWGVELGCFIAAMFLGYIMLRKNLSPFTSIGVLLASFLTIFQVMSGNFSEEYAICFQIGIMALFFLMYIPNNRRFSRPLAAFGMGILIGLVFCLKQTYVDLAISLFLLLIIKGWMEKDKKIINHLLWMVLGFALVNFLVFFYFYFHGALNDYIVGAFLFNRFYAKPGLLEWMHAFLEMLEFISAFPFFFLMGCLWLGSVSFLLVKGWPAINQFAQHLLGKLVTLFIGIACLGLFTVAKSRGGSPGIGLLEGLLLIAGIVFTVTATILFIRKNSTIQGKSWKEEINLHLINGLDKKRPNAGLFLILGLLDLPIVILSISISGMNFPHYFISLFTPLFLFFSAGAIYFRSLVQENPKLKFINFFLAAGLAAGLFFPGLQIATRLQKSDVSDKSVETSVYLKSVTTPQNKILVWGWGSVIYFLAEREPPTRYFIQFPAYLDSPYREDVLQTILDDIQANPPMYIVDTMESGLPFIEGKTTTQCLADNQIDENRLHSILNFVCTNYIFDNSIEEVNIYRFEPLTMR